MGKRGPRRTPTATLKLRGSWLAKTRKDEPQPTGGVGPAPEWLKDTGKAKWQQVCGILEPLGLATSADADAIASYCEAWQDFLDALEEIEKYGAELVSSKGARFTNPAIHRKQSAWSRFSKIGKEFGLTPASRADLHANPKKPTTGKADFFKKKA